MAQGFDRLFPPNTGETFANFAAKARTNQSAINTLHSGTAAPTNPEDRQLWLDTSVTPNLLKIFDAGTTTWKTLDFLDVLIKEVVDARGTTTRLDARLDQALNEDGTLKASTTLNPDEFKAVTGTPTRTAATIFTKVGDQTAIYTVNRRVKMSPGPNYSRVVNSVFTTLTTVTVADSNVPVGITAADVGIIDPTAATTGVDAKSLASPSGGVIEDYLAKDIIPARRGLTTLLQDFDEDPATTTGLTWGFKSGILPTGAVKAAGTIALTASTTNFVFLHPVSGVMAVNTTAFLDGYIPIRRLVTGVSTITTSTDARPFLVTRAAETPLTQTFRGLHLRTHPDNDLAAAQVMLVRADEIVMDDGTRVADWDRLVANIAVAGAGGLDTGAEAASTWYEVHAIRKSSDGTKSLLLHRAKDYFEDETSTAGEDGQHLLRDAAARTRLGQGFKVDTAGKLEFVDIKIAKIGAPTGEIFVTIRNDAAGVPGTTVHATSDKFDVSKLSTNSGFIRFPFRNPFTTVAATQYHLVLEGTFAISGVNHVLWRADTTAAAYANGSKAAADNGVWTADADDDFIFKIFVTRNDTAVTMPTGFDQKAKIGYVFNTSASNFSPLSFKNRTAMLLDFLASGTFDVSVSTLVSFSSFIPPLPVVLFLEGAHASSSTGVYAAGVPHGFGQGINTPAEGQVIMVAPVSDVTVPLIAAALFSTEYQAIYVNEGGVGSGQVWVAGWEW